MTATTSIGHRPCTLKKTSRPHFASGINFYKLFWIFSLGSVMGFLVETLWCLIKNGRLEVRATFLFGPFNVIYGIGALALYVGLQKINKSKPLHIFLFGMVAGTVVEHLCSFVQEKAFGTMSWDYSHLPLNIGGRVCLLYSAFWGVLAIAWVKFIQPGMEKIIAKIPNSVGRPLTWALAAVILLLAVLSIVAVSRWNLRLEGAPATNSIAAFCDRFFHNDFMSVIYPSMKAC